MATFRFEAGNLRALRNLPLYALGALAALLVPRSRRIWVFGCGVGPGEGALPLYRYAEQHASGRKLYWLATSADELREARSLGLTAVPMLSARGLWLTLRACVIVVNLGRHLITRPAGDEYEARLRNALRRQRTLAAETP